MTRRLAAICLVTVFLIGIGSLSLLAQDPRAPTLKGISAVYVVIPDLPESAKLLGLTKDEIRTDVELKLRLAGVRVVPEEEGVKLPGGPFLAVLFSLPSSATAAAIDISLCQDTRLVRNSEFAPSSITWHTAQAVGNPTGQGIRNTVKDLVDAFLNAWLSVNPKK